MITEKELGEHTIYGSWDDTYGYEVLVYWHPNGDDCSIFQMAGSDYGGGISGYTDSGKSADVERILDECKASEMPEYEFHTRIGLYITEQNKSSPES